MKFKLDENLPLEAAEILRGAQFDVATVLDEGMSGSSDPAIALVCQQEERTLVTLDLDFADIRAYPPKRYHGLVVLRLSKQDAPHVVEVLRRLIPVLLREPLERRLWIVEEERIRVRD